MNGLQRCYSRSGDIGHGTKVLRENRVQKRKIVHTSVPAFLKWPPESADPSVLMGRANFKPSRWWSSKCATQTALACMTLDGGFNPRAGPIGALGISTETTADFGKQRRTTTKAPPGEMLIAVANSRESLPFPSLARIKTGIASCNRAHFRSSFFDSLRGTCRTHH